MMFVFIALAALFRFPAPGFSVPTWNHVVDANWARTHCLNSDRLVFPDPEDATSFIQCFFTSANEAIGLRRKCPAGQIWRETIMQCGPDYQINGTRSRDPCSSSEIDVKCHASQDPQDCAGYYTCSNSISYPMCCPSGTSINSSICHCQRDPKCTQECKLGPYQPGTDNDQPTSDTNDEDSSGTARVLGGTRVIPGDGTWMAFIESSTDEGQTIYCGASLVTNVNLLTAAHCVARSNAATITARLGCTDLNSPQCFKRGVSSWLIHPEFLQGCNSNGCFLNDVAILLMDQPVQISGVINTINSPAAAGLCQVPGSNPVNQPGQALLYGWGSTAPRNAMPQRYLQRAQVAQIGRNQCASVWQNVAPSQLCAGSQSAAACVGDDGSPLVVTGPGQQPFVVGIASVIHGTNIGTECYPVGIYTRICYFADWINANVQRNAGNNVFGF